MLSSESETMLTDTSTLSSDTDFLTEELSFSTLAPVHLSKSVENATESPEQPLSRGSSPEYLDLDRSIVDAQEMSFYDDFVKNNAMNTPIKSEQCFSPVYTGQSDVPFDPIEVIFRDQMEEIQRVCQALGMLPGMLKDPTPWKKR